MKSCYILEKSKTGIKPEELFPLLIRLRFCFLNCVLKVDVKIFTALAVPAVQI